MSQVKISGNASGTGIFTIASPNGNTDRTLTLPDAAGTIQVSGNPISGTTGTFTGLVDISAAGAGQIQFPATQNASANANTLDDYEEGTFTPTITAGGGGSPTGGTYTGFYTKIGRTVFATMAALGVNKNTLSGQIRIALPFAIANNSNSTGCVRYGSFSTTAGTVLVVAQGGNGDSYLTIQMFSKDAYLGDVQASNLSSTFDIYNITYVYNT